jgi:hypothetical protein
MADYYRNEFDARRKADFVDPTVGPYVLDGGRVLYEDTPMIGSQIGVIYDRRDSVLLKHGHAALIQTHYNRMLVMYRSQGLFEAKDLVMLTFDARELGVKWLNQAILTSGSIVAFIRMIAQEKKIKLPEGEA